MNLQDEVLMKIYDKCEAAGIRDVAGFIISKMVQVYDWLKGAFPRGILPTDIDGEVEINGYFLRLEFKQESRIRNGAIPKGQDQCFRRLVDTGFHTVFLIGIDANSEPTCLQIYGKKPCGLKPADRDVIRKWCAEWAEWAEKQPRPKRTTQSDS